MRDAPERDGAGHGEEDEELRRGPRQEVVSVCLSVEVVRERMEDSVPVRDDNCCESVIGHGKRRRIEREVLSRHVHGRANLEVKAAPCLRAGRMVVRDGARQDGANRDERDAKGVQTLSGPPSRPRIELRGPYLLPCKNPRTPAGSAQNTATKPRTSPENSYG